ncbi:unnamed protein product [Brassica oleracea var. botrytis]
MECFDTRCSERVWRISLLKPLTEGEVSISLKERERERTFRHREEADFPLSLLSSRLHKP